MCPRPRNAGEGCTRSGICITVIPALNAARTPFSESSRARHCCGATPRLAAAFQKDIRVGLAVFDLIAADDNVDRSRIPASRSFCIALVELVEVATATGIIWAVICSRSSNAPSFNGTAGSTWSRCTSCPKRVQTPNDLPFPAALP